jgi:hypothetical protein
VDGGHDRGADLDRGAFAARRAPASRIAAVPRNLATAVPGESSLAAFSPSGLWAAAMTWGMPEPRASGQPTRVSHTTPTNIAGVSAKGA